MRQCTGVTCSLAALSVAFLLGSCSDPAITKPFEEAFDSPNLASHWKNTGAPYEILQGRLHIKNAYNHPLWLKKRLPRNGIIELDVESRSSSGDIKVEAWGDGETFARHKGAYFASGYVFVMGGWGNSISIIARMDEHGPDRKERRDVKVVPRKVYHWKIHRQGNKISWFVDGKLFLEYDDPDPLEGPRHQYFGFNDWQASLFFDNLKITPLGDGSSQGK